MFCKKCGAQMPNGQRFCSSCGAELTAPEAPAAPAAEPTYENWTTPIPKTKPKKGKAKIWILSVVGALLVAAIVCGIVFWPNISGFFSNQYNKLFNKEEYLEKIEHKNLEKTLDPEKSKGSTAAGDVFAESLRGALDTDPDESREITLKFSFDQKALSKDVIQMLQDAMADEFGPSADMDFSWFKNVALSVELDKDLEEGLMGGSITAQVNDKDIISAFFCFDFLEGKVYFQVPDLSAKYMVLDLADMGYDARQAAELSDYAAQAFEALESVDQDKLNKIILRYADIIVADLGEPEIGKEELTAGGVTASYTTLSVTVNGKKILKICKDVLTELADDRDIEDIFYDFTDQVEFISPDMADNAYDEFLEEINGLLEDLEDADPEDFPYTIPMIVYTDAAGNIVGRSIKVRDEDKNTLGEFSAYTVSSGMNFGAKAELKLFAESGAVGSYYDGYKDLTVTFEGSGEKSLSKELSGSFDLSVKVLDPETKDTLSLKLLKIGLNAQAKTDYVDYKINLAPTDDLIKVLKVAILDGYWEEPTNESLEEALEEVEQYIPEEAEPLLKMLKDVSIELRGVISKDERSMAIAVMIKRKDLASLGLESRVIESADIVIPGNAIDPDDWADSIESDKLFSLLGDVLSKLKDAGVPSSLIEMLRGSLM